MPRLIVKHTTVYRYRQPVGFGEHRLMFRPRTSHDMRVIDTALMVSPSAEIRWMHDVFSNSIAVARFADQANELRVESLVEIEHFGLDALEFPLDEHARTFPFRYHADEVADLGRSDERHYPDPQWQIDAWARTFLDRGLNSGTQDVLFRINTAIHEQFRYQRRHSVGVQTPVETLSLGSGTCRDLAVFMMEAVRSLGFAARFVSGYLYDPALDTTVRENDLFSSQEQIPAQGDGAGSSQVSMKGAGDTHAWVQVFLPGAGWVEFDPTNGLVGGANLIRVAVARDPAQAVPLQGTYFGPGDAFEEMQVDVQVLSGD
jgi:transglutaminase-like putative cysteine protease